MNMDKYIFLSSLWIKFLYLTNEKVALNFYSSTRKLRTSELDCDIAAIHLTKTIYNFYVLHFFYCILQGCLKNQSLLKFFLNNFCNEFLIAIKFSTSTSALMVIVLTKNKLTCIKIKLAIRFLTINMDTNLK